jgi:hypothetical protein
MRPRWVGFDLDECIGSVMPLYAFVKEFSYNFELLAEDLYNSEATGETWLLRPAIYDALRFLYRGVRAGKIYGAFILSNNSSKELVQFIGYYCNFWIRKKFEDAPSDVFKMAIHRGSPLRSPNSLEKSLREIQRALSLARLPLLTNVRDLLFFDDMVHVLTSEIPGYVQVRPYLNTCPVSQIAQAFRQCAFYAGEARWKSLVETALQYEKSDKDSISIVTRPTLEETIADQNMFRAAFQGFFGMAAGRRSRRLKHRARKNTLRRK